MHRPVIYREVKPLHRDVAYPTVPHELTQNDEVDKYSHRTMDDSKRDVSRHLDEYAESQEIRQIQREREYQQRRQNKAKQERKKQDDWER